MNADVTVIMSVFNEKPALFKMAAQSIIEQTYTNLKFLIVNDGSTSSDTLKTMAELEAADRRIEVVNKPHTGLTDSLNTVLSIARSEFIARQDSDDWSEPERIQFQIDEFRRNPALGIVGSNVFLHRENSTPLWSTDLPLSVLEIRSWFLKSLNPFCHGSVMFRRDCAIKAGMYRTEFKSSQDFDFFSRLCEISDGANLKAVMYHYRYTAGAISSQRVAEQLRYHHMGYLLFQQRQCGEKENLSAASEAADRYIENQNLSLTAIKADRALLAGNINCAFTTMSQAIGSHPCNVKNYLRAIRMLLFVLFPPLRKRLFFYGK
jgi:glycosyltransferase involved in cell wall biosynthesis